MDQNSWNQYGRPLTSQSSSFPGTLDHSALAATGPRVATVNPYSHIVPSSQQTMRVEHVQANSQFATTSIQSPSKVLTYSPLNQGHEIVVSSACSVPDSQPWSLSNFLQQSPQSATQQAPKHTFLTINDAHQLNLAARPAQNQRPPQTIASLAVPQQQQQQQYKLSPQHLVSDALQLQQQLITKQSFSEPNHYESVSPVPSTAYSGAIGLQGLADISSSQEKIPVISDERSTLYMHDAYTPASVQEDIIVSSHAVDLPLQVLSDSPMKKQHSVMLHDDVNSAVVSMDSIISMVEVQGASSSYTLPLNTISSSGNTVQLVEQKQLSDHNFLTNSEAFINPNEILHTTNTVVESAPEPRAPLKKPVDEEFAHLSAPKPAPFPPKCSPFPKKESGFQDSFLSFLQGQKPETLSSVTSSVSAPHKKPQLPKYIPFVYPKKTEPAKEVQGPSTSGSISTPAKKSPAAAVKIPSTTATLKVNTPGRKVPVVTPFTKIVTKSDAAESAGYRNIVISAGSAQSTPQTKALKKKAPARVKKAPKVIAKKETEVVARQTSKRKAKELAEKRRKQKKLLDGDDFVGFSSGSDEELAYDSDKDPGWDPAGAEDTSKLVRPSSGSEDEESGRHLLPLPKLKGSTVSQKKAPSDTTRNGSLALKVVLPVDFPSDYNEPHNYTKGTYVIDRRDLTNHESFPVWRVEGGKLLRKFEPFIENGELLHRPLSTYSSYTDSIRRTYKAIEVTIRSVVNQKEILSVVEKYRPMAPDDSLEGDILMPVFNVYLQTLISQALEPQFLSAICKENGDEYYMSPLRLIEEKLLKKQEAILEEISWTDSFKSALEKFPNFMPSKILKGSTNCEVTTNIVASAFCEVTLHGVPYDPTSLVPSTVAHIPGKFLVGEYSSKMAQLYHQLQHFKYSLYKYCELNHFRNLKDILDQEIPSCKES
ncbi:hypothetical protein CAPTEDRAFT_197915 [Capitella teleta]|uniref:DUF4211 domain-containing protein n=1 Tax=Capitella teleta TaxID=283909 RepID=R7U6A5_CAPTE|nr:hypothetical protein CAPTEDRAFT_197915 [Capitella teleta]|eukprot:ELU01499.1 hypothetical protein CAPTEDRAFT_197915 [Capitella teleta]